jgi:hypothetical protein
MKSLNKIARVTVRLTEAQHEKLVKAAKLVGRDREERVDESSLLRELAMPKVDELLVELDRRSA